MSFRLIAKCAFILVVIGFFCPVACGANGFQLANASFSGGNAFNGLLFWLLFLSAGAGVAIGVMLYLKKSVPILYDWVVLGVCGGSAFILFLSNTNALSYLQIGGILIILGVIAAVALELYSKLVKKEV